MICCHFPCTKISIAKEFRHHPIACSMSMVSMIAFAVIAILLICSQNPIIPHPAFWGLAEACVTAFISTIISLSCINRPKHFVQNL